MTADDQAARVARAERWARTLCGPDHPGGGYMDVLLAEYDARADRGASLELEERAHAATSAECARLEAENERLRAQVTELHQELAEEQDRYDQLLAEGGGVSSPPWKETRDA